LVGKSYKWAQGAKLEEHSKRKHKVLREYFFDYLRVRCSLPQRERFRLAIVDGFCGGGRYECGSPGSPLIFLEELKQAITSINISRKSQNLKLIEIECFLILNDEDTTAIDELKPNLAPILADIQDTTPELHLQINVINKCFQEALPEIKNLINAGRYSNVLFNLDPCGHSDVQRNTIHEIMHSYNSAEIFYTFMIDSLLAFLQKKNPEALKNQLGHINLNTKDIQTLSSIMNNKTWLGTAEKIVFDAFQTCAQFVSTFSINNPNGWRYWLIHFANNHRARQVYNDILHKNSTLQAHYGRSGLHMLHFDPRDEVDANLYLFDKKGRAFATEQLREDIPRLIKEAGDTLNVYDFYRSAYNMTPAHSDDIHQAMIDNPEVQILTSEGGERRSPNTIKSDDILKLHNQRSLFPYKLPVIKKAVS